MSRNIPSCPRRLAWSKYSWPPRPNISLANLDNVCLLVPGVGDHLGNAYIVSVGLEFGTVFLPRRLTVTVEKGCKKMTLTPIRTRFVKAGMAHVNVGIDHMLYAERRHKRREGGKKSSVVASRTAGWRSGRPNAGICVLETNRANPPKLG